MIHCQGLPCVHKSVFIIFKASRGRFLNHPSGPAACVLRDNFWEWTVAAVVAPLFFSLYVNGALPEARQMVMVSLAPAHSSNKQNFSHTFCSSCLGHASAQRDSHLEDNLISLIYAFHWKDKYKRFTWVVGRFFLKLYSDWP